MRHAAVMTAVLLVGLLTVGLLGGCGGGGSDVIGWSVSPNGEKLQIAYGQGSDFPQYGELNRANGYLKLVYGRSGGWGTSVILLPSLWSGGTYHQGAPITTQTLRLDGENLVIPFTATIAGLQVAAELVLSPPAKDTLKASVNVTVTGSATLDGNRTGEAFKPVMLSSMHASPTLWDAASAYLDGVTYPLTGGEGWVVSPPVQATVFGPRGGTSAWKTNATTIEIALAKPRLVTGWSTLAVSYGPGESNVHYDTDHDNVGLWASADQVLPSWQYTITAKK